MLSLNKVEANLAPPGPGEVVDVLKVKWRIFTVTEDEHSNKRPARFT